MLFLSNRHANSNSRPLSSGQVHGWITPHEEVTDVMHQQSALGKIAFKSHTRHWSLWAIILLCCAPRTGVGYVVLTKEGYSVEHHLMSQAGVVAGENFTVHGLTINTPTARLRCNPSRRGALRWSDSSEDNKDGPRGGSFEACDGNDFHYKVLSEYAVACLSVLIVTCVSYSKQLTS